MLYSLTTIKPLAESLRSQGKKIVLATGFFDLFHQEHHNFLARAKAAGDTLIVGVESDARARQIKGEGRPRETQSLRCQQVASHADYVIALPDDFSSSALHAALLTAVRPHVLAVSSHTPHLKNKRQLVSQFGGKLRVVHQHNPSISTTNKLQSA